MLFQTSYSSKETRRAINELIGEPFGFIRSVKMGGIGSQRLLINDVNHEIQKLIKKQHTHSYTNIELRPRGILIMIRVRLDNWSLALPYSTLDIIQGNNDLLLVSNEWKLQLASVNNDILDTKFINKLIKLNSETPSSKV